ncbi:MAG TPA: DUF1282 domain-containing protein [Bacteroidetes bacterium]|nr:DUF1282 domain-containing protein [Bacteroidota bacterium]
MKIEEIYERAIAIMSRPGETWETIRVETGQSIQVLKGYLLPFSLLIAATSLFGQVMFGTGIGTYAGIADVTTTVLMSFFTPLLLVFSLFMLSYLLGDFFGGTGKPGHHIVWLSYAFTPLYLADTLSSLHWTFSWIMVFGLYSAYLLWTGIPYMCGIPAGKRFPFFVMILLLTGLFLILLYWLAPSILL